MTGLVNGAKYFFAVKSYNSTKTVESSFSNEVNTIVPTPSTITADFSANATTGNPGMVVSFTPVTTGTISQWSWSFGDGGTSTASNPSHTYNLAGSYTVGLTVTGADGTANKIIRILLRWLIRLSHRL
ncbi:MAG: PKD domain-containing protein [Methylococcaceae bacterium]|nr:PKD domain-containing protein [Methylococcaceae bacterium]